MFGIYEMKPVYLPIETTKRELYGKTALALGLCQLGCTVYLGSKQEVGRLARSIGGGVYVDKGFHDGVSQGVYSDLMKNDTKVVVLDEENAVDFSDFQQLHQRFPAAIFDLVSTIYLWGVTQYDELHARHGDVVAHRALVTGHPRFELLLPEYQDLYVDETQQYKNRFGDFILINTNFGLGNNIKPSHQVAKTYGSRFPQLQELMKYQADQVNNFIELALAVKRATPFNVVIRPHPEENELPYIVDTSSVEGIFVEKKGSVIPAILASKAMIHHDCTTALECAMLGRDSLAYLSDHDPSLTTEIPTRISLVASSIHELLALLSTDMHAGDHINHDILEKYFSFPYASTAKVAADVARLTSKSKREMWGTFLYLIGNNMSQVKSILSGRRDELSDSKLEGLTAEACEKILKTLTNGVSNRIQVAEVSPRLFQIKSR